MQKDRLVATVVTGIGIALLAGCSTPKPAQLPVTERDRTTYVDAGASKIQKEEKYRVAILVKQDNIPHGREVADALDSALASVIGDFAFFSIVERSNLDALLKEQQLESLNADQMEDIEIPEADYLITAKVNAARVEENQRKEIEGGDLSKMLKGEKTGTEVIKTYYTASMSVDFRFYEKKTKRTILAKNMERKAPGEFSQEGQAAAKLAVAAQECAKVFAMELGARYAPPARVVEVRGNGKVAKVNIGTNYGLAKGVKVEFFEYVDNSDIVEGATREPSPVGYGTVIESDLTSAWVEVLDAGSSFIKRGHYAKITSDQSKGLKDQFRDALRLQ